MSDLQDIIPPHGFIHKPSPLWPVDLIPEGGRVTKTKSNPPPEPGHADTLKPTQKRVESQVSEQIQQAPEGNEAAPARDLQDEKVMSQGEMIKENKDDPDADDTGATRLAGTSHVVGEKEPKDSLQEDTGDEKHESSNQEAPRESTSETEKSSPNSPGSSNESPSDGTTKHADSDSVLKFDKDSRHFDYWEPKPPKVLMENGRDRPLELRSQIQLYATTEYVPSVSVTA